MSRDYTAISYQYCLDVVNDTLPNRIACKLEKLACQRQLRDLERQHDLSFPYTFDASKGNRHCRFMEKLPHVKGSQRGELLTLEPHQVFMHHTLFAWVKKETGFRRYTKVYFELPRKNGKSFSSAGIGLYCAFAEKEKGAEVFAGATSLRQAMMVFEPAWQMVSMSDDLKDAFGLTLAGTARNPTSIYRMDDMSRFEPIVGKASDGNNPTCSIIDEYHEHSDSSLPDSQLTGMGSRQQPLLLFITTAGFDTSSPCYEEHLEAIKVLEGTIEKENTFCIIFGIDPTDEWSDWECWRKANPNYGVSITADSLKETYHNAMTSLKDRSTLLTKHLNVWMNGGQTAFDMLAWDKCKDTSLKLEDFKGQRCFVGMDLASKLDLCAVMFLFPVGKEVVVFGKYYLPSDTVDRPENKHWQLWRDEGLLTVTPGARTDYRQIEEDLIQADKEFKIIELAFDQKEASYLVSNLQTECSFECVEINQSPAMISEPMKELEAMIMEAEIKHNGDKLLTWCMSNVIKKTARSGGDTKHYFPTKQNNSMKIDPAVAIIMGLSRLKVHCEDDKDSYNARAARGEENILRVL